jgi:hypothetical protein
MTRADPDAICARPARLDDTGELQARDEGQRGPRLAFALHHQEVREIQAGRRPGDGDFARPRDRGRGLHPAQAPDARQRLTTPAMQGQGP